MLSLFSAFSPRSMSLFPQVQRPHARKPYQKGQWRIKLKHGILQVILPLVFALMENDVSKSFISPVKASLIRSQLLLSLLSFYSD